MCVGYGVACQILDKQCFVQQFAADKLDRPAIREIVDRVTYQNQPDFDKPNKTNTARITVTFIDGDQLIEELPAARSIYPGLTDEEIMYVHSLDGTFLMEIDFEYAPVQSIARRCH